MAKREQNGGLIKRILCNSEQEKPAKGVGRPSGSSLPRESTSLNSSLEVALELPVNRKCSSGTGRCEVELMYLWSPHGAPATT
jgi:hypothetical protein